MLVKSIFVEKHEIFLECSAFRDIKPFITYPTETSLISLYQVSDLEEENLIFTTGNILSKAVLLLIDDKFIATPLIHSI